MLESTLDAHSPAGQAPGDLALLPADHPGVHDQAYRARREAIADMAREATRRGRLALPLSYTDEEHATWRLIVERLGELHARHASRTYLRLRETLPIAAERVPDLVELSAALRRARGFELRAIPGLIPSRDFLGGLARRVMSCTQYLRHPARPDYTPEPDVVHEVVGHVPLLADPDFAEFSAALGRAALEADERQSPLLERLYWFTLEFGLVEERGGLRAYGAGLLSSFGELPRAFGDEVERRPFRAAEVARTPYVFCGMQPLLFVVPSFAALREEIERYLASDDYARGQ
jgi:phenylalanine-4-hydroxylase